jgi:hypothetical protein
MVDSWRHEWCPNVDCSCNTACEIQSLIVVIPDNPVLRDKIFAEILQILDGKVDIHFVNDKTFFHLSEVYYKILKMKSKSLDAFVHENIPMNELRSSLQNLMSLTSQSRNSQSSDLQSKLFLINSTFFNIRPYDLLRKSFPCTRTVLLKHSKEGMLNGYIQKFLPNFHLLNRATEIQEINWLEMWSAKQAPSVGKKTLQKEC